MAYQLRERDPLTLEDMQKGALAVEVNLIEKRARMRAEKKVTYREDTTTSTFDSKFENLILAKNLDRLERMMEKMVVQANNQNRNQSQNQNQNFRRNTPPNR